MTSELTILALTIVLALFQILLTATFRFGETGGKYAAGPRDVPSRAAVGKITARLQRAQANLFETLPLFIGAILLTHIAKIHTPMHHWGAVLYFASRVLYLPLYATGIAHLRSVVWGVGLVGILMLLLSLVHMHAA